MCNNAFYGEFALILTCPMETSGLQVSNKKSSIKFSQDFFWYIQQLIPENAPHKNTQSLLVIARSMIIC